MASEGKELKDINIEDVQFLIDNQIKKNLDDFLEKRREKAKDRKEPLLFISATPRIVKDDRVDVFDSKLRKLLQNPPRLERESYDLNCCTEVWRPTLYGIKAEIEEDESMEVLRNGHIELIALKLLRDRKIVMIDNTQYCGFFEPGIVEYLVNFVLFLKEFLAHTSISEPVFISVALLNSKDIGISKNGSLDDYRYPEGRCKIWTEGNHLILPSIQINSIDNPHQIAKVFADRIWNAFLFEKAPFFDEKGNYIPPT